MSLLYIFAASGFEARPVERIAEAFNPGSPLRCGPNDVVLIVCGMGPQNARSKAETVFADGKPDAALVIGLCGGLKTSLPEGTIVSYTDCLSTDPAAPPLTCSPDIVDMVPNLKSAGIACDSVVGITSPRIATTREERVGLARSGAAVVDMETYAIVDVARSAGLSTAVLRVVADSIDRDLPDFNRALNRSGGLDRRKALTIALGSPLRTGRLLAANKRAMEHLTKALQVVLKAKCLA
jgi:nucleoside phosphorylase